VRGVDIPAAKLGWQKARGRRDGRPQLFD